MITHEMGIWKVMLRFTMVFADGEFMTDCLDPNPGITDQELITACNRTNPERWGQVVAIRDRRATKVWQYTGDAASVKAKTI